MASHTPVMRKSPVLQICALLLATAALAACAQSTSSPAASAPEAAPAKPTKFVKRVSILTVAEWNDPAVFSARASQIAGLPVRDPSMSSPHFFSMTLICADEPACDAGIQRLTDAKSEVTEVRLDLRMTIPRPFRPSASSVVQ